MRILCLHGYHGNAEFLRRQMAPLTSLIENAEYVYVDAPSLADRDFGWWHSPSRGWDRTRDWAIDLFATAPHFGGVFGFSQGAALTGLLAGMQQAQAVHFDFAIMVGGFKNDAPQHAELYQHKFALPSVHIIGSRDGVIPPHESQELADQFENAVVLKHSGGHIVPGDPVVVDGVAHFLDRMSRALSPADGAAGSGDIR
jgi:pimeloyl-ACP methyl ester carboxylesterase